MHPRGPVGLLIGEMTRVDARTDENLNIRVPSEKVIHLINPPFLYLGPTIEQLGRRARTQAHGTNRINSTLRDIDEFATKDGEAERNDED